MSTIPFVNYYTATGQITSIGQGSPTIPDVPEGMSRYLGAITGNSDGRYFLNDIPTDRPTMNLTVNGLIITGIPENTSVDILYNNEVIQTETITDGEIDLTGSSPGSYELRLINFPYIDETITLEVS